MPWVVSIQGMLATIYVSVRARLGEEESQAVHGRSENKLCCPLISREEGRRARSAGLHLRRPLTELSTLTSKFLKQAVVSQWPICGGDQPIRRSGVFITS
jgi:hypothetical protein